MTQTTITDPLLTLHQLFSPSFPIGAFAYSQGLETAIQDGVVSSPNDLSDWISGLIVAGSGWSDAIFLALSAKGGALDDLSDLALAMCPSAERRLETEKQGSAFARTANALYDLNVADAPYPVAVGAVVHALGLPMKDAVRLYVFSILSNLSAVGMRLVPLGQTDGQKIISDLSPVCVDVAERAISADLDDIGTFAPLLDVASMRHETLYSRTFRS